MGKACNTHEGDENGTEFGLENLKVTDRSQGTGVDRNIILKLMLGKWSWR
jgi:hypothetical protein